MLRMKKLKGEHVPKPKMIPESFNYLLAIPQSFNYPLVWAAEQNITVQVTARSLDRAQRIDFG